MATYATDEEKGERIREIAYQIMPNNRALATEAKRLYDEMKSEKLKQQYVCYFEMMANAGVNLAED